MNFIKFKNIVNYNNSSKFYSSFFKNYTLNRNVTLIKNNHTNIRYNNINDSLFSKYNNSNIDNINLYQKYRYSSNNKNNTRQNQEETKGKQQTNTGQNQEDTKDYYKEKSGSFKESFYISSRDTLIVTLKAIGIVYLLREYVISYSLCSGTSMQPTLNSVGDLVLIDKTMRNPLKRDDIIMAVSPSNPSDNICKRIKYLEGDIIMFDNGYVSRRVEIPKGYCWIEGDNPRSSFDSRSYGPIPLALIKGVVICRIYPFSWLDTPPPQSTSTHKIN